MNYYDEIEFLRDYVCSKYNEVSLVELSSVSLKERRKKSSQHWAAMKALEKCYDHVMDDPIEILNEILNDFNIEATFLNQPINKDHYSTAAQTVDDMIFFLKERRK